MTKPLSDAAATDKVLEALRNAAPPPPKTLNSYPSPTMTYVEKAVAEAMAAFRDGRIGVGGLIAARKDLINSGARLMQLVKLRDVIAGRNKTPMPGPRLTYTNG